MKGTFALTFDTELIWGSFDQASPVAFGRAYPHIRETIRSILAVLEAYEVPATWAVVGHLFLDRCERDASGLAHPELATRPRQGRRSDDWYASDPCTDRCRDPLWYGDDILEAITSMRTHHEIACHSFGHAVYGDPAMTEAAVHADLTACISVAAARGLELSSFVFPRNREAHHAALRDHGFRAFRGAEPTWQARATGPLARAARLTDHALGAAPPVSIPEERLPGLWNIPGSALIPANVGPRRLATGAARRRKYRAGLRRAIESGGVFHLWTHPFNLASGRDGMIRLLEDVVREASDARERGDLLIEPMTAIADRMAGSAT